MKDRSVAVVIPTWQRPELLRTCVASVIHQDPAPDEVLVVGRDDDAASVAVIREISAREASVRWISVDDPGIVPPIVRGLAASRSTYTAFIDDDAEARAGWLAALLSVIAPDDVAVAGGMVFADWNPRSAEPDGGCMRWHWRLSSNVSARVTTGPVEVDSLQECNWMWNTDIIRGLEFDPALDRDDASMYGLDLCLQAKEKGFRVLYDSSAVVVDHQGPRPEGLDRADRPGRIRSYCRNYSFIVLKHSSGFRRLAFLSWWWIVGERGAYGVLTLLVDLLRAPSRVLSEAAASFAGKIDGVRAYRGRAARS